MLAILLTSFSGWKTFAGEPKLQPASALRVFDANGKLVGDILSMSDTLAHEVVVVFKVGNRSFPLIVFRNGFAGNTNQVLMFASSDCSGPAFMDAPPSSSEPALLPGVLVGLTTIYIQDGPSHILSIKSNLDVITPGSACNSFPGSPDVREVVPGLLLINDLDTEFMTPFSLQ